MTASLPEFHRKLAGWYATHGRRDLPWRNTDDPYKIWLSEVMLQQTQVKTVLERFYFPFLERFPSVEALAAADLQEVLQLWQGLGYYNRARNLHRAAQIVVEEGFPKTAQGLEKLPGIGRNTAHALAVFAFHQPVPVMEANVKRVISRIFALKAPGTVQLWQYAGALLDSQNPFDHNQAMMDLGATVCTPAAPRCDCCPASGICLGKASPQSYPQPVDKKSLPDRDMKIVLFTDDYGRIFIQPRNGNFLHGLWGFPEYEKKEKIIYFKNIKYKLDVMHYIGSIAHAYSHFRLVAGIYQQVIPSLPEGKTPEEIRKLPLSRTEKKILELLKSCRADVPALPGKHRARLPCG